MTLVASGDLYMIGSAGTGPTRSVSYEIYGSYAAPKWFRFDLMDDACLFPVDFAGDKMSDFYGHTQADFPNDPTIVSGSWVGDIVDIDWTNGTEACVVQTHTYVYSSVDNGAWVQQGIITYPTSIDSFFLAGVSGEKVRVKLVSYASSTGVYGNDVISAPYIYT